jgi:hypothetical protein
MPTRLPSAETLPCRWGADDAVAVLTALDASGLSAEEFSRRTGIQLQRMRRWRARLSEMPASVRLVEVVARPAAVVELVEVVSPGGWRLRVAPTMLVEVVRALAEAGC